MSVLRTHTIVCKCGAKQTMHLALSINGQRSPSLRKSIVDGELHRCSCEACGATFTVEKEFYYVELPGNVLYKVSPRGDRHMWREAAGELDAVAGFVQSNLPDQPPCILRTVFGMDELREKLVANDLGFDDRLIELFKVLLVYEHPFLLKKARLRLALAGADETKLSFLAAFEHSPEQFNIHLPRQLADHYAAHPDDLKEWSGRSHAHSIFALPDHWVNMWRWSPQPGALEQLRAYAQAGSAALFDSKKFSDMLNGLPRGSHLPPGAKRDLRVIFALAKSSGNQALQDRLFEIRFGFALEDDWSTNKDLDDIDTLWMLLKDLPDTDVEGNTKIHELKLDVGKGGGFYVPQTGDISIGSRVLNDRAQFENVVRHEVGHAVHEMRDELVTEWLVEAFGWRTFDSKDDNDLDAWIAELGGWESLTANERADVRAALRSALGAGQRWTPGVAPTLPPAHPWNKPDYGPRLAFENSGENWYLNFKNWHRASGKAYFLNFWYRTLIVVDESTLEMIERMPSSYAAMSHYEFFAELYALYHDLDDPARQAIPASAMTWFETNLGGAATGMPSPPQVRSRKSFEDTIRPHSR